MPMRVSAMPAAWPSILSSVAGRTSRMHWGEKRAFAKHRDSGDAPYVLTGDFAAFQEDVLDYCLAVTERAGVDQRRRAWPSGAHWL